MYNLCSGGETVVNTDCYGRRVACGGVLPHWLRNNAGGCQGRKKLKESFRHGFLLSAMSMLGLGLGVYALNLTFQVHKQSQKNKQ